MPPAIIAGGIAAVGTIGGAVLSSSAQKKAANTAAAAETNAANQNAALARQFQQTNQANLQPFLSSGTQSNDLINSFLFGKGSPTPDYDAYLAANPDIIADYNSNPTINHQQFATPEAYAAYHYQHYGKNEGRQLPTNSLLDGYQKFTQSPAYQFPLQEGMRQLNTGLASRGQIKSGDAMKAAIGYGQDYASGQLNNFLGLAENQTNRGIQAGGAIAGVGVNALNSITNSNNAIGNAAANRAIAGGIANQNLYSGIGSALGQFAGAAINPSSYRF